MNKKMTTEERRRRQRLATSRYRAKHPDRIKRCKKIYSMANWRRLNERNMFGGNRQAALRRDGYKCLVCGMTNEEHISRWKRSLTVDHIDGTGTNTKLILKNNKLENLQTLCVRCHVAKDRRRSLGYPQAAWYRLNHAI